jgi:hypothetical protein
MLHCNMKLEAYLAPERSRTTMSKQLTVASAFSVFALSALALFAPGSARVSDVLQAKGATIAIAAPQFSAHLPLLD